MASPLVVLLVSSDTTLIKTLAAVIQSIEDLTFRVVERAEKAAPILNDKKTVVVVYHLVKDADLARGLNLVEAASSNPQARFVLIVGDQHNPAHALALLKKGAAEYLARPLDMSRL